LRQEGMIVRVTEVDPICAMQACMDGYEVVSPYIDGVNDGTLESIDTRLMASTDLIVTCTGNVNVCDENLLRTVAKHAIVCNIGHFDTEIDTQFMRDHWRWEEVKPQVHKIFRSDDADDFIILLSEGRLVNLGNATGHPSRIMDGSFANQVLAQMYLYELAWANQSPSQRSPITVEVLPKSLDEEVARYMVEGFGGTITQLTTKQADYIQVTVDGPYKSDAYKY
jgi:adenosylhomocysteinase